MTTQHDDKSTYTPPPRDRFRRSRGQNGNVPPDDRTLNDIIRDATAHAQALVRGEIDLAKAELRERTSALGRYLAMLASAAVLALVALIFLGHFAAQALNLAMPAWAAYLIVTLVFVAGAVALGLAGRKGLQSTSITPEDSIDSAREDFTWVKTHT